MTMSLLPKAMGEAHHAGVAYAASSSASQQQGWPWRAMATALALEAVVLGLLAGWPERGTKVPAPAHTAAPMMLSMVEPTPAPAPAAKSTAPVRQPVAQPRPAPLSKPTPAREHKPAPAAHETVSSEAPPIKTVTGADAPPAPAAAPTPAPAAPAATLASGPDDRFVAKLRSAVQAAVVYPMALHGMGLAASIDVEFVYTDGAVSNVHVVTPGRVATLDQAAVAAVLRATMPPATQALAGSPHAFRVRVIFKET